MLSSQPFRARDVRETIIGGEVYKPIIVVINHICMFQILCYTSVIVFYACE